METKKDPQNEIGDADAVSEHSGNLGYNFTHVSFENIAHTSQHHDDSSTSHTKNGGNQTAKSDTQPLNASVTPNKPHILI